MGCFFLPDFSVYLQSSLAGAVCISSVILLGRAITQRTARLVEANLPPDVHNDLTISRSAGTA